MLTPKQPFSNRNRLQTVELPQRKLCCNNFAIGFLTMADIGFCVFNEIGTDSSLRHYLIGTQKWAAKAVETPLFSPPKSAPKHVCRGRPYSYKIRAEKLQKTCCVTATAATRRLLLMTFGDP